MHLEQKQYCENIKDRFPEYFKNKNVLDVGSLDINGNNRYLFENCEYTGIDLGAGKNVDIIYPIHKFNSKTLFDVIISTEMLEHDKFQACSLIKMFKLLKQGGLMLITAATMGREEHGTYLHEQESSPFTNYFYKPVIIKDFTTALDWLNFDVYEISLDIRTMADIRFLGIKKQQ